ncbi:hypothetical protein [Methylobacterium durans]|uniref:hypothetical protein n=1 Tax=Methylobacterium durans TaxID=2202825 RepID=UPI0013A54D12|nr:hypothetical protein [Methylobacterium durans]
MRQRQAQRHRPAAGRGRRPGPGPVEPGRGVLGPGDALGVELGPGRAQAEAEPLRVGPQAQAQGGRGGAAGVPAAGRRADRPACSSARHQPASAASGAASRARRPA